MTPFCQQYRIDDNMVDCFGRLKPSKLLFLAQDMAGRHCVELGLDHDTMAAKNLFWAVIRHKVQVTRLPRRNETVTVQTWPMPTTRVAYPRATVAYDAQGNELFRIISLWVLMDLQTRAMILTGKSGVEVAGLLTGSELTAPGSLAPRTLSNSETRSVRFTDLDRNGHMNNCRYPEWAADLLPSAFHQDRSVQEFTVCYLSEARENQVLTLHWELDEAGTLQVESTREETAASAGHSRVFALQMQF